MDVRTPQADQVDPALGAGPDRTPVKFLYPTGSKPLEGYTIKRGVGRGGFGEVYFATSDAGKEVALKLIRRNLDVELRGVKHCLNLKHQNLIGIYDIRTDSVGDQWVVMEYVSGESLEDAIDRHPNGMPIEQVIRWMRGIGAGVAYLHDHGIVHRDLKPGNVFLDLDSTPDGTIKIGDYGLSKFISCSRRSGQTESVGTVHYMAPEIANGRYGREIDTYALGIMLYEMLTGHVPFEGESVGEVLMKHLTAEPNLSKLESPFREIVERTLAKDPEVRIGSVSELIAMLPDGRGVDPLSPRRKDSWTAADADNDGIGAAHLFPDTSVRGSKADNPIPLASKPISPPTTSADSTPREPIYDWVTTKWNELVDGWHDWEIPQLPKALMLLAIVAVVVASVGVWGGPTVVIGIAYAFYYVFWSLFVQPGERRRAERKQASEPPVAKEAEVAATATSATASAVTDPPEKSPPMSRAERRRAATIRAHKMRMGWKEQAQKELATRPWRDRLTDLLSSMVLAGILCGFLSLLVVVLVVGNSSVERMPLMLWLSAVSTLGCWVVLAVGKFTEGKVEDQVPMRIGQMVGGALVGLTAWGLSSAMMIGVPFDSAAGTHFGDSFMGQAMGLSQSQYVQWHDGNAVVPDVMLSVMYFSIMMLLIRWWRMVDFTRRSRLGLWSVGMAICGAWMIHLVCWYPQPTGMAVAAIMAVAVQLVASWLPPSRRKSMAEKAIATI